VNLRHGHSFLRALSSLLLLVLWRIAFPGVVGGEVLTPEIARRHVIMINQRGQHIDPAAKWDLPNRGTNWLYPANLDAIHDGIAGFYRASQGENKTNPVRVVVFVHGGLNSYNASKKRLEYLLSDENHMLADGYYPLLVVWNSGFVSSYIEHLLDIRQGEVWPIGGKITAPLMLAVDLGRGLVRLPLTLGGRWVNDLRTTDLPNAKRSKTAAWESLEAHLTNWQQSANLTLISPPVPEGKTRSVGERAFRGGAYIVTQPTKIAVLPFADGLAGEAWNNMIRRTRTMFQPPDQYDFPTRFRKAFNAGETNDLPAQVDEWMRHGRARTNHSSPNPDGTMYSFTRRLTQWSTNEFPGLEWHFIGHSMGTIVLNELFRVAPDIRAKRVTYMAAACSIRDFQERMVPYLRRQRLIHKNEIEFYNLCLHRIRERDNSMDIVDLIPRGTLLNYIDDIFANPATITDRTLGSWENVIRTLPDTPNDLRPQVHHVCFDLLPWSFQTSNLNQPQNHSSFTADFAFWKEEFALGPTNRTDHAELRAVPATPAALAPTNAVRQSPLLKK
jgi:pimeloyl-ACP methyl ester carboxylesterase